MDNSKIDIAKVKAVILYIIEKSGTIGLHKLFKIIYFAEQDHLVKYGRKIVNDNYVAMPYGPVASQLFDIINEKRRYSAHSSEHDELLNSITIINYHISATEKPDLEELSISDMRSLDLSLKDNAHLNMDELTEKSHKYAWKKAKCKSNSNGNFMNDLDIAVEGGASEGMLGYISECNSISLMLQ